MVGPKVGEICCKVLLLLWRLCCGDSVVVEEVVEEGERCQPKRNGAAKGEKPVLFLTGDWYRGAFPAVVVAVATVVGTGGGKASSSRPSVRVPAVVVVVVVVDVIAVPALYVWWWR